MECKDVRDFELNLRSLHAWKRWSENDASADDLPTPNMAIFLIMPVLEDPEDEAN